MQLELPDDQQVIRPMMLGTKVRIPPFPLLAKFAAVILRNRSSLEGEREASENWV